MQVLSRNPAWLQLLLHRGAKQGLLGAPPALPPPALSAALLQLALGCHGQKPGILGDSPLGSLPPAGSAPARVGEETPGTPGRGPKSERGEGGAPAISLLGEPPKNLRIPLNPYLNLQSLLPAPGKGFQVKPQILGPPRSEPLLPPPEFPQDLGSRIFPQNRDHSGSILGGFGHGRNEASSSSLPGFQGGVLGPPFFGGSPRSCFSSGLQAGLRQSQLGKNVSLPPSSDPVPASASPTPQLKCFQTPLGGHKRPFPRLLPSPEPSPEGAYVGQHSQGLGGHYADSHLKRKRIF